MKIKIILTILNIQTIALPLLWCQRLKWGMGGPNEEFLLPLCQTSRKTSFRKSEQYISFPQVTHSLSINYSYSWLRLTAFLKRSQFRCQFINSWQIEKRGLQVYSVPQRYFSSSRDSLQGAYVNRGASEFDLSRKPKRRDQLRGRFKLPYTVTLSRDQSHLHTPASVNHLSNSSCNGTETWVSIADIFLRLTRNRQMCRYYSSLKIVSLLYRLIVK